VSSTLTPAIKPGSVGERREEKLLLILYEKKWVAAEQKANHPHTKKVGTVYVRRSKKSREERECHQRGASYICPYPGSDKGQANNPYGKGEEE